jgi:hypothetical protein
LLIPAANPSVRCKGPDEALHEKLAREAKDDRVEGDKGDIVWALAVHRGAILLVRGRRWVERVSMVWWEGVGEKDSFMNRIGFGRVDCVGGKDNQDKDQRVYPGVFE